MYHTVIVFADSINRYSHVYNYSQSKNAIHTYIYIKIQHPSVSDSRKSNSKMIWCRGQKQGKQMYSTAGKVRITITLVQLLQLLWHLVTRLCEGMRQ